MDILNERYIKESNFVTRSIAEETIIVPINSGVGDLDSIYTLNEVGSTVWKLIDGERSTSQIVEAIIEEFEVTREEAIRDVLALLAQLQAEGLIRPQTERED